MERWGGHSQAAGLSLKHEKLALFKQVFLKEMEGYSLSTPTLEVDFPLSPKRLRENSHLREDIERLQPFGAGNPYPRFVFEDKLTDFRRNRYGFVLYFERNGRLFMNATARDKNIPQHLKGKRLRVVYSVDNPKRLELTVEDFTVI